MSPAYKVQRKYLNLTSMENGCLVDDFALHLNIFCSSVQVDELAADMII